MRDEPSAVQAWVKADLRRRYDEPKELPAEIMLLVERLFERA